MFQSYFLYTLLRSIAHTFQERCALEGRKIYCIEAPQSHGCTARHLSRRDVRNVEAFKITINHAKSENRT